MALSYKKILILDVEATCWEKDKKPENEIDEIIEIGGCLVDLKDKKIVDNFFILIKPTQSKISEFCTKLTSLTDKDLENGSTFEEAHKFLKEKYNSEKIPWGSWGDYDREMILKECKRRNIPYPLNRTHLNLKAIFAIFMGLDRGISMESALKLINMDVKGRLHRAVDDAYNIARILLYLIKNKLIICPFRGKNDQKKE